MNYVANIELEELSRQLCSLSFGSYVTNGRIETFELEEELKNKIFGKPDFLDATEHIKYSNLAISSNFNDQPPIGILQRKRSSSLGTQPSGKRNRKRACSVGDPINELQSRQLLLCFIALLNEAFPDYDFENVKANQFIEKDLNSTISIINSYLAESTVQNPQYLERMWATIDNVINIRKCEIFQFYPDTFDEEQHANVWSFQFMFFDKESKRLCYFNCSASSKLRKVDENLLGDSDSEYDKMSVHQEFDIEVDDDKDDDEEMDVYDEEEDDVELDQSFDATQN